MQPFTLTLPNAAIVTGLANIPAAPTTPDAPPRPLVVALHGGSHSAHYYDFDASHTAAPLSTALSVPFIAINRPGYLASTSFLPLPPSDTRAHFEVHGAWLHAHILPLLWTTYGARARCNAIVLFAHSLGAPGAVVCAALHAADAAPAYPLCGLVFSGFGARLKPGFAPFDVPAAAGADEGWRTLPPALKGPALLPPGTAAEGVRARYEGDARLNTRVHADETASAAREWFPRWRAEWARQLAVPVMVGLAGEEAMWEVSEEHVEELRAGFGGGVGGRGNRVDVSLIPGAPHNLEISYWAQGWYARTLGFALECAAEFEVRRQGREASAGTV
ncbi:hypothetical protein B0J12DRAFT_645694 [Macrophomina phaseolina]|uniref:AB hydrolase-1 domain-containing protein n=1 Tax=Macrophomina phaseolina TaxID=35725 RepID=A0ABQ8GQQ2_9PEZI|nr:hypothetical protein B0J12DRAFT_645694 [Macrophomina phaseolina]